MSYVGGGCDGPQFFLLCNAILCARRRRSCVAANKSSLRGRTCAGWVAREFFCLACVLGVGLRLVACLCLFATALSLIICQPETDLVRYIAPRALLLLVGVFFFKMQTRLVHLYVRYLIPRKTQ